MEPTETEVVTQPISVTVKKLTKNAVAVELEPGATIQDLLMYQDVDNAAQMSVIVDDEIVPSGDYANRVLLSGQYVQITQNNAGA